MFLGVMSGLHVMDLLGVALLRHCFKNAWGDKTDIALFD